MRTLKIGLAVVLVASLARVEAADSEGLYAIRGAGLGTCEQYIQEREAESPVYYLFVGWVEGYLTAVNRHLEGTYDVASWESTDILAAYLAEHCQQNLEQPFHVAVLGMQQALGSDRLEERSPRVEASAGERRVVIYQETLKRAQARLAELGHYDGPLDGVYGPGTRKAFEVYQEQSGLTVTGLPDQPTLFRLLRQGTQPAG